MARPIFKTIPTFVLKQGRHTGGVGRIGFVSKHASGQWVALLLVGSKTPLILKRALMSGEYKREIRGLALTAHGDEVDVVLSGTGLKSFTNHMPDARLGTTR